MPPTLAAGIASVRRRHLGLEWIELAGRHASFALFALGVAVLGLRVVALWSAREAAPLLALAALSLLSALWLARQRRPSVARAAAWLDVHGGGRGLVVTETELGASPWSDAARVQMETALAALPRIECAPALRRLLPAAGFAALALFVPIPRAVIGPPPVLASAAIEELHEKLATLEETLDVQPELAQELEARLERLEDQAARDQPASTFEAIDRLGERLDTQAAQTLDAAQRANQDLAAAASDPHLADAQAALDSALKSLAQGGLAKDLPPGVKDALQPGSLSLPAGVQLSSAQLAALSQELKGALDAHLGKLAAGGLLDPAKLAELKLDPGKLGDLSDLALEPGHVCDEECKKPGGT